MTDWSTAQLQSTWAGSNQLEANLVSVTFLFPLQRNFRFISADVQFEIQCLVMRWSLVRMPLGHPSFPDLFENICGHIICKVVGNSGIFRKGVYNSLQATKEIQVVTCNWHYNAADAHHVETSGNTHSETQLWTSSKLCYLLMPSSQVRHDCSNFTTSKKHFKPLLVLENCYMENWISVSFSNDDWLVLWCACQAFWSNCSCDELCILTGAHISIPFKTTLIMINW